jgi:hypothetical protein
MNTPLARFTRFFKEPFVVVILICCLVIGGPIWFFSTVDHSTHPHAQTEQVQPEASRTVELPTVVASPPAKDTGYRAYMNDDRITSSYEPAWDADVLIYKVTDGESEDRTPLQYVREWTPQGNPFIRCIMMRNGGGVACFRKGD